MFDFSFSELLLTLLIFILFVNPKKIPEILETISRILNKYRNIFLNIKEVVYREYMFKKLKKIEKEVFAKNNNDK
jgi:Sec-independent protein translocase protein TatA